MGIAYVVVGGICIVLGALFTVAHLVKPRYVADRPYSNPIPSLFWLHTHSSLGKWAITPT